MVGGLGNDTYFVDNAADGITEFTGQGIDWARAYVNYTLPVNVEIMSAMLPNLVLTGNGINNVIYGDAGRDTMDTMYGMGGNDLIKTYGGNDFIDGGTGLDTMEGGYGNDTYVISQATDVITELATDGTDEVLAGVSYTLGANIERITLTGTGNVSATGNTGDNTLTGNTGTNFLTGGAGSDTYVIKRGDGSDTITDTSGSLDVLFFDDASVSYDQLWFRKVGTGLADLEVSVIGSTGKEVIKGWFSAPTTNRIEQIRTGDGKVLLDTAVDNLIAAMTGIAVPNAITLGTSTNLTAPQVSSVTIAISANWS